MACVRQGHPVTQHHQPDWQSPGFETRAGTATQSHHKKGHTMIHFDTIDTDYIQRVWEQYGKPGETGN